MMEYRLSFVTPVHIGSGVPLDPTEAIFDRHDSLLHRCPSPTAILDPVRNPSLMGYPLPGENFLEEKDGLTLLAKASTQEVTPYLGQRTMEEAHHKCKEGRVELLPRCGDETYFPGSSLKGTIKGPQPLNLGFSDANWILNCPLKQAIVDKISRYFRGSFPLKKESDRVKDSMQSLVEVFPAGYFRAMGGLVLCKPGLNWKVLLGECKERYLGQIRKMNGIEAYAGVPFGKFPEENKYVDTYNSVGLIQRLFGEVEKDPQSMMVRMGRFCGKPFRVDDPAARANGLRMMPLARTGGVHFPFGWVILEWAESESYWLKTPSWQKNLDQLKDLFWDTPNPKMSYYSWEERRMRALAEVESSFQKMKDLNLRRLTDHTEKERKELEMIAAQRARESWSDYRKLLFDLHQSHLGRGDGTLKKSDALYEKLTKLINQSESIRNEEPENQETMVKQIEVLFALFTKDVQKELRKKWTSFQNPAALAS